MRGPPSLRVAPRAPWRKTPSEEDLTALGDGYVGRWAVMRSFDVTTADADPDGTLLPSVVRRWAMAACDGYLDLCSDLMAWCASARLEVGRDLTDPRAGLPVGTATTVAVSATATEVRPREFVLAVRLRAMGGEGATIDARCMVTACAAATGEPQPLPDRVREELIAIEHGAAFVN